MLGDPMAQSSTQCSGNSSERYRNCDTASKIDSAGGAVIGTDRMTSCFQTTHCGNRYFAVNFYFSFERKSRTFTRTTKTSSFERECCHDRKGIVVFKKAYVGRRQPRLGVSGFSGNLSCGEPGAHFAVLKRKSISH